MGTRKGGRSPAAIDHGVEEELLLGSLHDTLLHRALQEIDREI